MFTIFGWRNGSKIIPIPNNTDQFIITNFKYFHIWWVFRITIGRDWQLGKSTIDENGMKTIATKYIDYTEVVQLMGSKPVKPWWFLFNQSLITGILIFIVSIGIVSVLPKEIKELSVKNVISSSIWTQDEEDFVAKNASDQESAEFTKKFKKTSNLEKYLVKRSFYLKEKKINSLQNISTSSSPAPSNNAQSTVITTK